MLVELPGAMVELVDNENAVAVFVPSNVCVDVVTVGTGTLPRHPLLSLIGTRGPRGTLNCTGGVPRRGTREPGTNIDPGVGASLVVRRGMAPTRGAGEAPFSFAPWHPQCPPLPSPVGVNEVPPSSSPDGADPPHAHPEGATDGRDACDGMKAAGSEQAPWGP